MSTKKFDLQAWLASTGRDVRRDDKRVRAVAIRRHFDAPIERVWSAWVEGWTTKIVDGEPKLGATVVLDLGQPKRTTCKILACEPPTRLAATWTYGEPGDVKPDEVEVTLTAERGGTRLALEHRSENGAPWAPGVGAGWEAGIMMFEAMFRGDDPTPLFETFPALDAFWTQLVDS
jgi:uncharacterized protein YndB with AHSA1/START domain